MLHEIQEAGAAAPGSIQWGHWQHKKCDSGNFDVLHLSLFIFQSFSSW